MLSASSQNQLSNFYTFPQRSSDEHKPHAHPSLRGEVSGSGQGRGGGGRGRRPAIGESGLKNMGHTSNMHFMRKALGVCAIAAGITALALTGSGVAAADTDVTGQKYSDAQGVLSSAGLKPVVQSTVGDQLAWPDCVVTRTQKRTVPAPPNSSASATKEMLVTLNCDAAVASPTAPGNSAASPEGRAAAAAAAQQASGG